MSKLSWKDMWMANFVVGQIWFVGSFVSNSWYLGAVGIGFTVLSIYYLLCSGKDDK